MSSIKFSIAIVTKNRKEDLDVTIHKLKTSIDINTTEILILLDGCTDNTKALQSKYPFIKWYILDKSVGASKARSILYKNVKGEFIIGFDDDAHPLQSDFIDRIESIYNTDNEIAVIAFQEIKGVFTDDQQALQSKPNNKISYYCNDFVGCGFVIKTKDYFNTRGFPVWIDIYGEESCVSIEVLANNKKILYTNFVSVNHRVDVKKRKQLGANYFRFEKQLKNTAFFYIVYYPKPTLKIAKLLYRNFFKYAVKDLKYFMGFIRALFKILINFYKVLNFRKPISKELIDQINKMERPIFY